MKRFNLIIYTTIFALLLLIGVFFYGRHQGKLAATPGVAAVNVSSQLILDRISSEYFLVTKTVFADSQAEIETPKQNDWKDLFVGSKITVSGLIRVDIGVDMKELSAADIIVDASEKTVTISLPLATVLDSSLYGELDFKEDKAILDKLKSLFKDTENEDYNRALQTLLTNATKQVSAEGGIFNEARVDSAKLIELIVNGLLQDYRVIVK